MATAEASSPSTGACGLPAPLQRGRRVAKRKGYKRYKYKPKKYCCQKKQKKTDEKYKYPTGIYPYKWDTS